MATSSILQHRDGGVMTVTLNRPDVLNAFDLPMARALQEALDDAAADDEVRVVVLTGNGRGFCAGQDLAALQFGDPMPDLGNVVRDQYNPVITRLRRMEKPILCAVNGVAAGAGANLALACDMVFASTAASFIQSFTRIGLIPDSGGTFLLPRLVGMARASALMMLCDKVSAAQAFEWGMIWRVCEPDALLPDVQRVAVQLATQPTRAFGLTKRLLNATWEGDLASQLELEEEVQRAAGQTSDFREGVQAFLEKRSPTFTGR